MKNLIVSVFGKKGSGKTSFTQAVLLRRFKRALILDSLSEYPFLICSNILDFLDTVEQNIDRNFFRITYRPLDEQENYFFQICYALRNVTLIIEEADLYSNVHRQNEYFEKLVRYGRHFQQNLIVISRRPAEISRSVTAQSDVVISFLQTEKRDIDYFRYYMDNPEQLTQLKPYTYPGQHIENTHYRFIIGKEFLAQFS